MSRPKRWDPWSWFRPAPKPAPPATSRSVVFAADFSNRAQWVAGSTSAYPDMGPTNPGDHKLDRLDGMAVYGGEFAATKQDHSDLFLTDLLTTEGSTQGFQVRAGDRLEATVTLPTQIGAWPAVWTWKDGGNEVDVFEYHPDNPNLLELSNHVAGTSHYYSNPSLIRPGATVDLACVFGAGSVDWYVGGALAFSDGRGVGGGWSAYLIVNLSVADGFYHAKPTEEDLSFKVSALRVLR